jgi:hypothetical protein
VGVGWGEVVLGGGKMVVGGVCGWLCVTNHTNLWPY